MALSLSKGASSGFTVTGEVWAEYAILYLTVKFNRSIVFSGGYRNVLKTNMGPHWNSPAQFAFQIGSSDTEYIARVLEKFPSGCGSIGNAGVYQVFSHNWQLGDPKIIAEGVISFSGLRSCDGDESPSDPGNDSESNGNGESSGGVGSGVNTIPAPYNKAPIDSLPATDAFITRDGYGPLGSRTYSAGNGGPPGFGVA